MKNDRKNEEILSTLGISSAVEQLQNNLSNQYKNLDFSNILKVNSSLLGINEMFEKIQYNWCEKFKNLDFRNIARVNTSMIGISAAVEQLQNNLSNQYKNLDFSNIVINVNSSLLGIDKIFEKIQYNWCEKFKNLDFSNMARINTSMIGISAAVEQLQNSLGNQYKNLDFSNMVNVNSSLLGISEILNKIRYDYNNQFKNLDFSNIKINDDGTINYLNETIIIDDDIDEINLCINSDISWEEKIDKILKGLKSKHPVVTFLIITFLIYPVYCYYIDCAKTEINVAIQQVGNKFNLSSDKNKIKKNIKDVSNQVYSNSNQDTNIKIAINEYRFVSADCLNIRISNSTNSKIIYTLKFGQVVRVLDKNKEWTLIEYSDDENVMIKGWVFNKYISKFN